MKPNPQVQYIYDLHTRHINKDTKHLGDVENLEEIIGVMDNMQPNVYMLAGCCTDNTPTLQLATWDVVRRMRIGNLSDKELEQMSKELERRDIQYKQTSFLALNPDFSETLKCKVQRALKPLYDLSFYVFKTTHPSFYKESDMETA